MTNPISTSNFLASEDLKQVAPTSSLTAIVKVALERLQESFSFVYTSLKERAVARVAFLSESKKALCSSLLVTAYMCYCLFVEGYVPTNEGLAIWALQNKNISLGLALHKRGVDFNEPQYRNAIENFAFGFRGELSSVESALASVDLLGDEVKFAVQRNILFSLYDQSLDTCTAVLKALKTHGWDLNYQDSQGKTAAHYAAEQGAESLLFLKNLGADMSIEDAEGKTPGQILASNNSFRQAVFEGDIALARLLKELGVSLDFQNLRGNTPGHFAALRGQEEMLELLDSREINLRNNQGLTPVHVLINSFISWNSLGYPPVLAKQFFGISSPPDMEKILRILQRRGADFNALDDKGKTAAHYAAEQGAESLLFLKNLGADMSIEDAEGKTPGQILASNNSVRQAVFEGDVALARLLKELGVSLDFQNLRGNTPGHFAALRGQEEMLELLDSREVNLTCGLGGTPAHVLINTFISWSFTGYRANFVGDYFGTAFPPSLGKTLLILQRQGADMSIKDALGKTPKELLASMYSVGDIEALRRDGTALAHEFAQEGRVDDLQAIAAVGANLDIRDRHGCSPLHYAAQHGKREVLEVLVSLGADVNARNDMGKSPVFAAVERRDIDTIEALAALGADLNAEDEKGCALANYALRYCDIELTKKLHELGAQFTSGKEGSLSWRYSITFPGRRDLIPAFFQFLYELDPDFFCKLQDERGRTIAHTFKFDAFCSLWRDTALPWEKCPLFVQDAKGNTPLHQLSSQEKILPWLEYIDLTWLEIRNCEGMTPIDLWSYSISSDWMRKVKLRTEGMAVNKEQFTQKAQELEVAFNRLWERLIFGEEEGQVPLEVFSIQLLQRGETTLHPNAVKAALDEMIENIKHQAAMLGTPRADEEAEMFSYYAFMLLNLEKIVYKLQEDPDTRNVARTLLVTALPRLDGLCATAWMEGIQQVAKTVAGEGGDLEVSSLLEKSASDALEKTIEASVEAFGGGNVHVLASLMHYFGFSPVPDPLAADYQRFINICQADIETKWSTPSVIDYLSNAFKAIPMDDLSQLIRDCSQEMDNQYLALQEKALAKERQIQESAVERLLQTGLSQELTEKLVLFFTSVEGASLAVTGRELLTSQAIAESFLELIQEKFSEAQTLSKEEVEEVFAVAEIDSEESLREAFTSVRKTIGLKSAQQIALWGQATSGFLQSVINWQQLQKKLLKIGVETSSIEAVLEIKQAYDQEMRDLSRSLMEEPSIELSISLKAYGLASKAILQESRLAFELLHTKDEAIFSLVDGEEVEIGSKRVLNQRGVCLLAERLQIFRRVAI